MMEDRLSLIRYVILDDEVMATSGLPYLFRGISWLDVKLGYSVGY